MTGDKVDASPSGWTGRLFDSWQFGNPLMASYQGYPFQVRGTDPASAADTLTWAGNGMQETPSTPDGTPVSNVGFPGFNVMPDWLKSFAIGGTGVFVGLALLIVGLLFLWKSGK